MSGRDGFSIGMAQVLALIPGVSRSGATISAGLFRGFDRVAAARYSFLLSIPAVVLSGLFELRKIGEDGQRAGRRRRWSPPSSPSSPATLSIAWLLRYLTTHYAPDLRRLPDRAWVRWSWS